jgi:UDP-glucose:(heptosyl)LPS alpha-1,3-glucosyltransferase
MALKIAVNVGAVGARRGGAEKYAGALIRALSAAGHEIHVVAREVDAGELPERATWLNVELPRRLGLGWLQSYRFARASERLLKKQKYDLIVGLSRVWHQDVAIAVSGAHPASLDENARRFRSPLTRGLWRASKWLSPKQWVFSWVDRKQFDPSRKVRVVAPAQLVADHFHRYHGVPHERIVVVPWGIEPRKVAHPEALRRRFRQDHGLTDDHVAVLFVARNYGLKGLEPQLEAFARAADEQPHLRLLVCGSRSDRKYRLMAERLGIERQVMFLGFVDDVAACFAAADVFAFPTFYDPCSLVVLEAMQAGLPVITTRSNGAHELIDDRKDGFVLDHAWDVAGMARALTELGASRRLRQEVGAAARKKSVQFDVETHTRRMLAALVPPSAVQSSPAVQPSAKRIAA